MATGHLPHKIGAAGFVNLPEEWCTWCLVELAKFPTQDNHNLCAKCNQASKVNINALKARKIDHDAYAALTSSAAKEAYLAQWAEHLKTLEQGSA